MNPRRSRILLLAALLLSGCLPGDSGSDSRPDDPVAPIPPPPPGSLDAGFGSGGIATAGLALESADAIALQPDGRIVLAGITRAAGNNRNFAAVRLNPDGTPDVTFDDDGAVTTDMGTLYDNVNAVAVQPDGKIIVAGSDGNRFALVRYRPDGSLDNDFGGTGKVTAAVGTATSANALALQPDGKIVATGYASGGGHWVMGTVRYNADGSVDTTFGSGGCVITTQGGPQDVPFAAAIQPDGRIVAAGCTYNADNDFAVVRYNADGSLDTSFGGDGMVSTAVGGGNDFGQGMVLQADGRIVVVGDCDNGSHNDFAVVRYNPDGSLDSTFGGDGIVINNAGSQGGLCQDAALQSDGKILVSGAAMGGGLVLFRHLPDGSLDSSFDGDGKVTTLVGNGGNGGVLAIQPDGRILLAGQATGSLGGFAVLRYEP